QRRARYGRLRCKSRGEDRRHDDHDTDFDARHSRYHGCRRCSGQRGGRRRRRGEDQALSRCRRARGPHRGFQPAGRAAWRLDARLERFRDPSWRRRALCRRAVPDSAAGSGTRSRRGAAAVRVTQYRAPDELAAPSIARAESSAAEPATEPAAQSAAAESAGEAGRSSAAHSEFAAEGQSGRAEAWSRAGREIEEAQSLRAEAKRSAAALTPSPRPAPLSLRGDAGFLDDRPPLVDLDLLESG